MNRFQFAMMFNHIISFAAIFWTNKGLSVAASHSINRGKGKNFPVRATETYWEGEIHFQVLLITEVRWR
jgi:hypothetical protein